MLFVILLSKRSTLGHTFYLFSLHEHATGKIYLP